MKTKKTTTIAIQVSKSYSPSGGYYSTFIPETVTELSVGQFTFQ